MSKSMTKIICAVTNDLNTDQRMHRICSSLSQNKYEVTLVGRELRNSAPLIAQPFGQKRIKCLKNKDFFFFMEYNLRLLFYLLFHKFDIVNAIDLDTIIPCWLAARLKGKKVTYDAHEWFPFSAELMNRPRISTFWLLMEKFFVPRMDAVYTVSQSIADKLEEKYHRQVALVRNMPISLDSDKQSSTKPYLLYQGALNVGRGLEPLIEAMQMIKIPLYIAGAGDIEMELREKVKQMGLSERVIFLGNLKPDDLWRYTQNAYIGVNLLENMGKSYYYSLANKFFDYVRAEVPQITMNFPEYIRMNRQFEVAILIPDLKVERIVAAITQLLIKSSQYEALQAECRQAKMIWNWNLEQKQLIAIYDKLKV